MHVLPGPLLGLKRDLSDQTALEELFKKTYNDNRPKKTALLSLLLTHTNAGEPCNLGFSIIMNQIADLIDNVKIDCTKQEHQRNGTMSDTKNVLKGSFAGIAAGALETIRFVLESIELIYNTATRFRFQRVFQSSTIYQILVS